MWSEFWRRVGSFFDNLIPPDDGNPEVRRWRWGIFVLVIGIWLVFMASLYTASGYAPWYSGIACEDDVNEVKARVDDGQRDSKVRDDRIQLILVKEALRKDVHDICLAAHTGNQQALDALNRDFEQMKEYYFNLKSRDYIAPSCEVVLVDGK